MRRWYHEKDSRVEKRKLCERVTGTKMYCCRKNREYVTGPSTKSRKIREAGRVIARVAPRKPEQPIYSPESSITLPSSTPSATATGLCWEALTRNGTEHVGRHARRGLISSCMLTGGSKMPSRAKSIAKDGSLSGILQRLCDLALCQVEIIFTRGPGQSYAESFCLFLPLLA